MRCRSRSQSPILPTRAAASAAALFLRPIRSPSPTVSRVRAARGRMSSPPLSCGKATISTTTQSPSARTRSQSAANSARRFGAGSTLTRCTPDRDGRCSVQGKSWRAASRSGYSLQSPLRVDFRCYPSPPRAAPAPRLATAFGGRGLAGGCSTARPSATRCPLRAGNRVLGRFAPCGPHHFPALRSGALAVSAPVLGRVAAGAAWGVCKAPTDVLVHCATRALCANPAGGGVLRCAAARGGSARHRAGATVAQPQPPLRPAQARAKLR